MLVEMWLYYIAVCSLQTERGVGRRDLAVSLLFSHFSLDRDHVENDLNIFVWMQKVSLFHTSWLTEVMLI